MPGSITAGTITIDTLSDGTNSTSATNPILGSAKAWVSMTATGGTPTINGSYNVSSVSYAATGRFTINFTNAMPNANYVYWGQCGQNGVISQVDGTTTTTSYTWGTYTTTNTGYNPSAGARLYTAVIGN